jgi:hypothetical protein
VRLIADNNDPSVPFFALQALHDAGMSETYADLRRRIASRFQDADWVALLEAGEWTGTALRGLFDVVREAGTPEERLDLVGDVLAAEAVDYGARMQALLELEDLLPFEDYRAAVQEELNRTRGDEPSIWQMGLAQLAQRLEGPVEVHAGPAVLTTHDIEAMTAREVPTMYEDLALRVEMMARQPDSVFDHGVLDKLNDVIAQARKYPLADDQANALRRIELLMPTLVESSAAGLVPPPPPGS